MRRQVCDASVNRMAEKLGCARKTVERHLTYLVEHGYLSKENRNGASSVYIITDKVQFITTVEAVIQEEPKTLSPTPPDLESYHEETIKETIDDEPDGSSFAEGDRENVSESDVAMKEQLFFNLVNEERRFKGHQPISRFKSKQLQKTFKSSAAKLDVTEIEKAIRWCFHQGIIAQSRIVSTVEKWDPNRKFIKPRDNSRSHIHEGRNAVKALGKGEPLYLTMGGLDV